METIALKEKTFYEAPFERPQSPGGITSNTKVGVLYSGSYKGQDFKVNISPFPGLSHYSLEASCEDFEKTVQIFNQEKTINSTNPHTQFAFYCLLKVPFRDQKVLLNDMVAFDDLENFLASDGHSRGREKTCLKIKITPKHDWQKIKKISKHLLEQQYLIRFDGNMKFSVNELTHLWGLCRACGLDEIIDYFEEPLEDFNQYPRLSPDVPYAHEEHLVNFIERPSPAKAIVIKPSQVGTHVLESLKAAHPQLRLIISSAFDLEKDRPALKNLALEYQKSQTEFHGLKTIMAESSLRSIKTIKL